jgi:late competence protein required for DNA uptake (superfamily II DNA/RNA helicase)
MEKDMVKLRNLYADWKTDDLKKAITVDKAGYELWAINIIKEELQSRNVTDDDLDNFHKTYIREEESLKSEGKLFCSKCHSLNIRKERPWWSYFIIGVSMFLLPKYQCCDCGHSFNYKSLMPKIDSTELPSEEEISEKWKGTPGMDHVRK